MNTNVQVSNSAQIAQNQLLGDVDAYSDFKHWDFSSALRHKRNVELRIDIRQAAMQIGISAPTFAKTGRWQKVA